MTEDQLLAAVLDIAAYRGWRVTHFRPAKTDKGWRTPLSGNPGFPDLVLARRGQVIFAELKDADGRLSPAQKGWKEELGEAYEVWRPRDLETIRTLLR